MDILTWLDGDKFIPPKWYKPKFVTTSAKFGKVHTPNCHRNFLQFECNYCRSGSQFSVTAVSSMCWLGSFESLSFFLDDPGIVRGIDTFNGVLHVITPVPQQSLEDVDLLLQGFIQIPTALLQ
ncbi:hypothetical protein OROGR_022900 [Orobanche gracilis]